MASEQGKPATTLTPQLEDTTISTSTPDADSQFQEPSGLGKVDSNTYEPESSEKLTSPVPSIAESNVPSISSISIPILEVDSAVRTPIDLFIEYRDDSDSAISAFREESTQSVRSSLYDYVEENGRTFHRYKEGKYILPNDETEQDRLDLQHQMVLVLLDGRLNLAPVGKNVHNVLDVGTGTGIWAIEYATQNPSAHVIGTDLSPIQPQFVPPNCQFEVDDAEDEWIFNHKFEFIHMRGMMTCFSNPRAILAKAFEATAPGGYLEMQDGLFPMYCHDDSLRDTALDVWGKACVEGAAKLGRPWTNTPNYKRWMEELGFENVVEKIFEVPTSTWPKGKKQKELGMWWQADLLQAVGASMAVLTRGLGWSPEVVERLLVDVRTSIKDRNVHAFFPIYIVYGRKPNPKEP